MTDPRYHALSLAALDEAARRGTTHKHRLMAWAYERIVELEEQLRLVTRTGPESFDLGMRVGGGAFGAPVRAVREGTDA